MSSVKVGVLVWWPDEQFWKMFRFRRRSLRSGFLHFTPFFVSNLIAACALGPPHEPGGHHCDEPLAGDLYKTTPTETVTNELFLFSPSRLAWKGKNIKQGESCFHSTHAQDGCLVRRMDRSRDWRQFSEADWDLAMLWYGCFILACCKVQEGTSPRYCNILANIVPGHVVRPHLEFRMFSV